MRKPGPKKKLLLIGGAVWGIVIAGLAAWALLDQFRSSPTEPRPWAEHAWNARIVEGYSNPKQHPTAVNGISVARTGEDSIFIEFPKANVGAAPHSIVVADSAQEAVLDEALTVRLSALYVGYADSPVSSKKSAFNSKLQPTDPALLNQQLLPYIENAAFAAFDAWKPPRSGAAELRFFITADTAENDVHISEFMLFDPSTHVSWSPRRWDSSMNIAEHRRYAAEAHFRLYRFHDRPLRLVARVIHGPNDVLTLDPKPGAVAIGKQFVCQLIDLRQARTLDFGWIDSGEVEVKFNDDNYRDQATTLLFGFSDSSPAAMRSVRVRKNDGKEHRRSLVGARLAWARLEDVQPDEIVSIAVEVLQHKTVIFDLSRTPGMPPVNEDPSNLFAVRTPYLHLRSTFELQQLLHDGAQFEGDHFTTNQLPEEWFPREYQDATIRRVFGDYLISVDGRYHFDQATFKLIDSDRAKWWVWLDEKSAGIKTWYESWTSGP